MSLNAQGTGAGAEGELGPMDRVGTETKSGFWPALELQCGCEWQCSGRVDFRADCRLVTSGRGAGMGLQNEAEMAEMCTQVELEVGYHGGSSRKETTSD